MKTQKGNYFSLPIIILKSSLTEICRFVDGQMWEKSSIGRGFHPRVVGSPVVHAAGVTGQLEVAHKVSHLPY